MSDDVHALIEALGKARATKVSLSRAQADLEHQYQDAVRREHNAQYALDQLISNRIIAANPTLLPRQATDRGSASMAAAKVADR